MKFNGPGRIHSCRLVVLCAVLMAPVALPHGVQAQQTNAEIFRDMAVECLQPVVEPYSDLVLNTDRVNPFLNQAVISAFRDAGKGIFLHPEVAAGDSLALPSAHAYVAYFVEHGSVEYSRRGRRSIGRAVELQLSYLLSDAGARVIADSTCSRTYEDEISRSDLDVVETESIPITKGERPRRSWIRRYAEPIVVASATAVAVYLFFNVRSDSNDSP